MKVDESQDLWVARAKPPKALNSGGFHISKKKGGINAGSAKFTAIPV